MRVLFVIDTLDGGGAARVTSIIANELIKNGYYVSIATNLAYRNVLYDINTSVRLYSFYRVNDQKKCSIVKLLRHAYYLRKIIKAENPNVIVGEQEGGILYSYIAKFFLNIPLIGHRHNSFKILGLSKTYQLIYKMPQKNVFLHNVDIEFVGSRIKNAVAIYNPHTYPLIVKKSMRSKQVICVGSLNRWYNKGFDIMIRIWGDIVKNHKEWKLIIVGGGDDVSMQKLIDLTKGLDCFEYVEFKGAVKNVDDILQESAIFALPSRVEGFPMVLNEAISQGCPSIAFSLGGVLSEIYSEKSVCQIQDGDIDSFKTKLESLMDNENMRNSYSNLAMIETRKYLPGIIVNDWIRIINEVTKPQNF